MNNQANPKEPSQTSATGLKERLAPEILTLVDNALSQGVETLHDFYLLADTAYRLGREAAAALPDPLLESRKVEGADYTWGCGCYSFCGNLIACEKHFPSRPSLSVEEKKEP